MNIKAPIKLSLLSVGVLLFACFTSCNSNTPSNDSSGTTDTTTNIGDDDNDFVENQTWSSTISIVWNGQATTVSGSADGVSITDENGYVTITSSAKHIEYAVSGSGTGQLKIYSDYKFKLSLNGLTLACSDGPAINNQGKKSCYVVLTGTNTLSDGNDYSSSDDDRKAALFSEGQIIVSGSGSLAITGNYKHALASDDYIRVREGSLALTATASDGMHANDGIIINGGTISISAAADAIQCDTNSIVISGGNTYITKAGDKGISAYSNVEISGGNISVVSVDKGIKSAAGNIIVSGGTIDVTTSGDDGKGILAKVGECRISDGTITVKTSGSDAKGIKSVGDMTISGGDITVVCSGGSSASKMPSQGPGGPGGNSGNNSSAPEGIESKAAMTITGGKIFAQSSDDAINSGGDCTISGGYVCAYSTGNDGLDANGNCYIKGGVVYAIGTTSPEVGIDANTEGGYKLYVQGGTIVAIGGLESGSSLTQSCYSASSWSKSTWYALYNGSDLALAFLTPASGGTTLIVSTPSTPSLKSGVTASNGTQIFNGMGYTSATISGGSAVSLSSYNGGNGGGGQGGGGGHGGRW